MNTQSDVDVMMTRRVQAQFSEMLAWLGRGWEPAPPGRRCPECGGPVWLKEIDRWTERHSCTYCHWGQDYRVR